MVKHAIVRQIPDSYRSCISSHPLHKDLSLDRARDQHSAYVQILRDLGLDVVILPPLPTHPDCIFVEDTAVVHKNRAVITNMGALSRRGEGDSIATVLKDYFQLQFITNPATIEGGDVLHFQSRLVSGLTSRTNIEGVNQTSKFLDVPIDTVNDPSIVHLKSYLAYLDGKTVFITKKYAQDKSFSNVQKILVPDTEIYAANALHVNGTIIMADGFPQSEKILKEHNYDILKLSTSEFAKCEGALTCLSILF